MQADFCAVLLFRQRSLIQSSGRCIRLFDEQTQADAAGNGSSGVEGHALSFLPFFQTVLSQEVDQIARIDSQQARGFPSNAVRALQRFDERFFLLGGKHGPKVEFMAGSCGGIDIRIKGKADGRDGRRFGEQDGPLDDIAQLANIAGPAVGFEQSHGLRMEAARRLSKGGSEFLEESRG